MKNIIPIEDFSDKNIAKIEDVSYEEIHRARIHFKNGYVLSVIIGADPKMDLTYGASHGLFEIAVLDKDGYLMDIVDNGCTDTVLGCCDVATVQEWIKKVGEYA